MYVHTCSSWSGMLLIDMLAQSWAGRIGDAQSWREDHCTCVFLVYLGFDWADLVTQLVGRLPRTQDSNSILGGSVFSMKITDSCVCSFIYHIGNNSDSHFPWWPRWGGGWEVLVKFTLQWSVAKVLRVMYTSNEIVAYIVYACGGQKISRCCLGSNNSENTPALLMHIHYV